MKKNVAVMKKERMKLMKQNSLTSGIIIKLVIKYSSFLILGLVIILTGISCNNNPTKDDVNTSSNLTEEVNEVSGNLKEDYNAWFQLQGKYIENFNLQIAEVKVGENSWNTQNLVVAMIENLTDKERGGFFIGKDIYFPVAALDEKILILEEIATQIKSEVRKYNCTRRYTTSYGITIIFQYSSQEHKWNNIQIYYSPDSYSVEVKPDCLLNYIQGLKECKKYIIDYTAKKWDNK